MYFLLLLGISAACLTDLASAQCDLQAAMGCLAGFQQMAGSTDMAATCSNFQKIMTCLAPFKENCNSDENYQNSMASLNSVESMCAGGAECTGPLQNCYKDAGIDTTGASMPEPSCEDAKTLQTCVKGLSTVCEGNYAYDQSKTSLQDVVDKCANLASAQCDLEAAYGCVTGFEQEYSAGSTDLTAVCSLFQKLLTCLAPLKEDCNSDENFQNGMSSLNSVKSICAGGAECTRSLQNCFEDAGIDTTGDSMPETTCEDAETIQTCVMGLSTVCEGNYVHNKSKTILQDILANCTNLAFAQCDFQAVMGCLSDFQQLSKAGSTDTAAMCLSFQKAMTCLAPLKENCDSDENFQNSMTSLNSVKPMCAGGAECSGRLQNCYVDAGIDTTEGSNPNITCDKMKTLQTCVMGLSTVCEGNYAFTQTMTSFQDVVSNCIGGDQCTVGLRKCYVDAGIDTTEGSNSDLTCEDAKNIERCLMNLGTVCKGNSGYDASKTSVQHVVTNCTAMCTGNYIKECNMDYTFPNGIPSKPDYESGCRAIECVESKYKRCFTDKTMESSIKKMKAFCMDANLKNGLETYKECLATSTINEDCKGHLAPKIDIGGNETEAEECMRIEEYAMCAKNGVTSCDEEGVQAYAEDTARKVIMLKASREGGIECSTSAGVQVFSSFVFILAAALLMFTKAF